MNRPLILISNDDGIESPGLRAAVEAVRPLGELLIVAPRRQQSSTGRGIGGHKQARLVPMEYVSNGVSVRAYACEATPAQTVLHGLGVLCRERKPDLLVSGINYGENLGTNITLSGTVGAAVEGACVGIPALAASLQTDTAFHHHYGDVTWTAAQHFVRYFAERMLAARMPHDVDLINLVVPETATPATPWRVTRQSRHPYFSALLSEGHLESCIGDAQIGVFLKHEVVEPDSDIAAVLREGVVSVTPLSLDSTSRTDFGALDRRLRGP